jgi:integrase
MTNALVYLPSPVKVTPKPKNTRNKGIYVRNGVYWVRFQYNGRLVRQSAGTDSITVAKAKLIELQAAMQKGDMVFDNSKPQYKKDGLLFKDFAIEAIKARGGKRGYTLTDAETFLSGDKAKIQALKYEVEKKSPPRFNFNATYKYFGRLKKVLDYFGSMPVKSIKPFHLTEYLTRFKGSNTKVNEALAMSGIYTYALSMGTFDDYGIVSPYRVGLHRLDSRADPIIHYWTVQQRVKFLKAADELGETLFFPSQLLKDMIEFAWLVGGRVDAFLTLTVEQIHMDVGQGVIHFPGHKLKGKRYVEQHFKFERAREIAIQYMNGKRPSDYLFTWDGCPKRTRQGNCVEYESLRRAFLIVCRSAGITEGANIHSLKKTYGMERAINGASPYEVQKELQHKRYETTEKHYLDMETVIAETARRKGLPQGMQDTLKNGFLPL